MTDPIAHARAAVKAHEHARDTEARKLAERDQAVRALYTARPELGPTEIAREIGLTASTVRAITRDLAHARRVSTGPQ